LWVLKVFFDKFKGKTENKHFLWVLELNVFCFSVFVEIMILNQEENIEIPVPVKKEKLPSEPSSSCAPAAAPVPPGPSSEAPESLLSKNPVESPAKKQPKNRVKLAANFSFAPITKL
jgi:hypothetical protein